jgi:hypothetical protein
VKASILKAITPVWAQHIEVERRNSSILITGWGHLGSPISSQLVPPTEHARLDILKRFHQYVLRNLEKASGATGVYQLADADSDEKLIAFCREFGPVCGRVQSEKYDERTGTWKVTVLQGMNGLRAEREKFLSAVELLAELNKGGRADYMGLMESMAKLGIDRENLSAVHLDIVTQRKKPNIDALLPSAHWVFCKMMNDNPPQLTPIDGEVIELPEIRAEGIKNALYYQLRIDYMAQRTIGTCLHCGNHFPVFKRGARACKESCRRALRNSKYWSKHRKAINEQRRADRTREE